AAELLTARDALRDWLGALPDPDMGPIHADVLRENVLVDGTHLSLIDFDDSGIGYRLYDLGTVMSQNLDEPHYTALRDALIAGYGNATVEQVEYFTLARTLVSVGWAAPRLALNNPVHRRHIERAVMWARRCLK
ncbi:MAG: phosphotransferase enzyme family protein, partial [Paracoccaceae bacterium]